MSCERCLHVYCPHRWSLSHGKSCPNLVSHTRTPAKRIEVKIQPGEGRETERKRAARFSRTSKYLIGLAFTPGVVVLALIPFLLCMTKIEHFWELALFVLPAIPISIGFHELGHWFVARLKGTRVRKLVLTPFGLGLEFGRTSADSHVKIGSGGPIANLLLALAASLFIPNSFALALVLVSLYLYLLNGMPGFRTDGSRIALTLAGSSEAYAYLYAFSLPTSAFLLVIVFLSLF